MNNEQTKDTLNEEENQSQQEAAENEGTTAEAQTPDAGEPAEQKAGQPAATEEEKWQKEAADWKDKYMRLYAEFDNFRKRSSKEKFELLSTASAGVIKELLPILDDFDRAIKANETVEDIEAVKEGFVLIHQKLYKRLEAKGLKPIDATGKPFDTDYHEAITQIAAPREDLKGKVVDEPEKGYLLNDKVIRFSKVVIGQ